MVFEDPNGTCILYDAGRTVAGPDDPRLGKIDVILVSHMHGDHIGDKHQPSPNAETCGKPALSVAAAPNTNTVNIALAKNATIVTGSEIQQFLGAKLAALGGKVIAGTKAEIFINATNVPVHVPLSGKTMEFDGNGIASPAAENRPIDR